MVENASGSDRTGANSYIPGSQTDDILVQFLNVSQSLLISQSEGSDIIGFSEYVMSFQPTS